MPVRRLPLPLAALALAAAALALPPRPAATPELSSLPEPPLAPAAEAPVHDLAGEASRQQGLAGARRLLEPVVARGGAEGAAARVHLGLLAHAREEPEVAELLLARGPGPEELEDWRLSVLADSAAANGHTATAIAALDELLARRPDSPLAERARLRLAELAWAAGDAPAALARVAAARAARPQPDSALELERLAWRIGLARRDLAALTDAGRRLLVDFPLEASKLAVVDALAARGGPSEWRLWLTPDELVRRAAALLAAELPAGALTTLAAVPAEARGFEWRLLEAEALTASGRGREALERLTPVAPAGAEAVTRLEWVRAQAASDAAQVRRGRANLPAAERERMAARAREHLLAVARRVERPERAAEALARLAEEAFDARRLDEAVAALRQLKALDPGQTLGARALWQGGWQQFEARNDTGAIGYWSELWDLYPKSAYGRSGRYWSARAHERLGHAEQAAGIYRELAAADTADFYARQAAERLAGGAAVSAAAARAERDPWPEHPALERAARLSDWGLDGLAATELALIGDAAPLAPRAALEARVAARAGDRRASLRHLRRAFPDLGTANQNAVPEPALALYYPLDFRDTVELAARREALPAPLVFGMIHQESGFDAAARSHAGARGLMQLMPATGREVAQRLGLPFSLARLEEPAYSVRLGTTYFRQVLERFDGRVELALAGYNGGPGRISRLWRAAGPDPELDRFLEGLSVTESRIYVKRILVLADSYRSLYPELG